MIRTNELVLLYNFSNERAKAIKMVLLKLGLRFKVIEPQDFMQQLGYLVKKKEFSKVETAVPESYFESEMMVMYQFSNNRIDQLLYELRKAGVEKIALKAIVTEFNQHWNSIELYEELKKEHEEMTNPSLSNNEME